MQTMTVDDILFAEFRSAWMSKQYARCYHMVKAFENKEVFYGYALRCRQEQLQKAGYLLTEDGKGYYVWWVERVSQYDYEINDYPRHDKQTIERIREEDYVGLLPPEFGNPEDLIFEETTIDIWEDYWVNYEYDVYMEETNELIEGKCLSDAS